MQEKFGTYPEKTESTTDTRRIYLDDRRNPDPRYKFTVLRTYDQFVNHIYKYGLPLMVSFDHDLADEHIVDYLDNLKGPLHYEEYKEKTGYEAAKWLVNFCMQNGKRVPISFVHSQNIVGAENIKAYLDNYYEKVDKTIKRCRPIKWDEAKGTNK
jgi:hypothetical protein